MAKTEYRIEGYRVSWEAHVDGHGAGWRCACWREVLPDHGARPTCRHTRYVEQQIFRQQCVMESGPKVVGLLERGAKWRGPKSGPGGIGRRYGCQESRALRPATG
jgi:hypothetical protein